MLIHNIKLFHEVVDGQDSLTCHAHSWHVKKGDHLAFQSDAGPVHVLMEPGGPFSASEYRTGDPAIEVNAEQPFRICAGITVDGRVIGFPEHTRFGKEVDEPPPAAGTTR